MPKGDATSPRLRSRWSCLRRSRIALGVLASLLAHGGLLAYLATRSAPPALPRPAGAVELEILEALPPASAASPEAEPARRQAIVSVDRAAPKKRTRAAADEPKARSSPPTGEATGVAGARGATPEAGPSSAPESDTDAPRGVALAGPRGSTLDKIVFGQSDVASGASQSNTHEFSTPDAGVRAEIVEKRVDAIVAHAQREHRLATHGNDGAVSELGSAFERAAVSARGFDEGERTWIQRAFASWFEELRVARASRVPVDSPGRDEAWDRIKQQARAQIGRADGYVALVEVRQGSDGKLVALKLLASSGAREFDARALGSVVRGLESRPPLPDAGALGPGALSLWQLEGEELPESEVVQAAVAAYRIAMLDIVPLKETIIEMGSKRLKYTARLLAVY